MLLKLNRRGNQMAKKKETGTEDAGKTDDAPLGPEPEDKVDPEADQISDDAKVDPEADQGLETTEIETVEELEIVYPKLVSAVRDEVVVRISKCSLEQVKTNMPEFYERLVMEVQNKSGLKLNVPGFLLDSDDPFAGGTLRTYQKLKGIGGLRLPHVLPFKDKKTKETLKNYILRALGGGDKVRADAARRAMEKAK
jgi:hypothetical protein